MTELLLVTPGLPADISQSLHIIQTSGRAVLAIINNILAVAKTNAREPIATLAVWTSDSRAASACMHAPVFKRQLMRVKEETWTPQRSTSVTKRYLLYVQVVDVKTSMLETTATFAALAIVKQLQYNVAIDPDMPAALFADEVRMQQILGNLIGIAAGRASCRLSRRPTCQR